MLVCLLQAGRNGGEEGALGKRNKLRLLIMCIVLRPHITFLCSGQQDRVYVLFKLDHMAWCAGQLIIESQEKSGYFFNGVLVGQKQTLVFRRLAESR